MKRKNHGFYRCLWTEDQKAIPFTWHASIRGAETIPKAYRYQGSVSSDYYHMALHGSLGLEKFATDGGMEIDWENERLVEARAPLPKKPCGHSREKMELASDIPYGSPQDPERRLERRDCKCGCWKAYLVSHQGKARIANWGWTQAKPA